ncbi:Nicotianamine synthase [Gaertneriomyces semiglobifer]|nr:Nicotianamine synthase [Gaertneriomyces semiglobifer]
MVFDSTTTNALCAYRNPSHKDRVRNITHQILDIYSELRNQQRRKALEPCPVVNTLFSKLVALCEAHMSEVEVCDILSDTALGSALGHLRCMCSDGESRLEMHWTRKMIEEGIGGATRIEDFPYYENYVDLTRMELFATLSVSPKLSAPRKFAFLGSGPLPLTSICLARELMQQPGAYPEAGDVKIHNIDCDVHALSQSSILITKLGDSQLSRAFSFEHADVAKENVDLHEFDVVYLAALVGINAEEKRQVVRRVHQFMRPGALLLVRSAHSLRRLLYPQIDLESLQGFSPLLVVHPHNHVINSVVIARRV